MKTVVGLRKVRMLRQFYDVTDPHSFAPDPTGGAYIGPPDPLVGFMWVPTSKAPTSKGRAGEGRVVERRGW